MSSAGTGSSRLMSDVIDSLVNRAGGTSRIGELAGNLLENVADEDSEHYDPKLAEKIIKTILNAIAKRDEICQGDDRLKLTDEEIEQQLRTVAMEWIATNPEFRLACFEMSIRRDPDLIRVAIESADDIEEIHASIARRNQRIPSASEIRQQREEERQRLLTSGEYEVVDVDTVEDEEQHEALEEEFGIGGVG